MWRTDFDLRYLIERARHRHQTIAINKIEAWRCSVTPRSVVLHDECPEELWKNCRRAASKSRPAFISALTAAWEKAHRQIVLRMSVSTARQAHRSETRISAIAHFVR
jgi:hypothetical protein